jgi:Zn-dependent protease
MNWSLGRLWGTELELNVSALIIVALLVVPGLQEGHWIRPTVFAIALVISILVHEFGHATVANLLGLGPCRVMVHGFGGLCAFSVPPTHRQGLKISLAGPAAGLLLAALAYGIAWVFQGHLPSVVRMALGLTVQINLFWSLFNLLPMFPLDGGQATRHLLHMIWRPEPAERTTRALGLVLGASVAGYGLWQQSFFFGLIGLMVLAQNRPPAAVSD